MSIGNKAGNFSHMVREAALNASHGYCQCSEGCIKKATEFHHMLPNTKVNCKKYPVFIKSIFNCLPINNDCHMSKKLPTIREPYANAYEWYLAEYIDL